MRKFIVKYVMFAIRKGCFILLIIILFSLYYVNELAVIACEAKRLSWSFTTVRFIDGGNLPAQHIL